jgi:hypothetical protein
MKELCSVRFSFPSGLNSSLWTAYLLALLISLKSVESYGQVPSSIVAPQQTQSESVLTGSIELDYNLVQDDDDYLMPVIVMELSDWHFEGRHNYEEKNSASLWIGYNLEAGKELHLRVTPLAGVVIGSVAGAAPGLELELDYGILSFSIQSEYFFNTESFDESFFYTWNEVQVTPIDFLYAGAVIERTKAYEAGHDVQVGLFGGVTYNNFYFTAYLFDPDKVGRSMLFALGWEF